jgi:filamentous hemagglutinin
MSKKVVRVRKSYVKQWFAVISGSLLASSMQAAQAAHDNDRPSFKEFRQQNPGIDRQALRGMFRQEFGIGIGGGGKPAPTTFIATPAATGTVNATIQQNQNIRPDRLTRRLERHDGIINQSVQGGDGNLVNLKNGVNLDLGSADRNITLGQNLFKNVGSVEINIGGETKTVQAGAQVTASEYVAVKQVIAGAGQKLTLDAAGKATGGEVDLSSITANNDVMRASDLTVPVNVTTYGDFGRGSDFKLQGDLTNYGSVYAVSSSKSVRGGTIHADDITNQQGGLISSVVSNSLKNELNARGKTFDLGLNAKGDLSNFGSITSSGSLTLTAGGNLTNTSQVSASNDVNLNASAIANSGRVESFKGNVNVDGPSTADLNVNNAGGTLAALNGAINVRNSAFSETFNTNVSGGDLLSRELNVNAGGGISRFDVNELTGTINQTGSEAHFQAATADMNIGEVCLTGDPTFKNSAGNINIAGNITVAEDLAIIASGNITSANNVTIAATSAGNGFNITMIAGAAQLPGGTDTTTLPPGTASGTTLTGFASTGGGSVLMGNGVNISSTGANPITDNAGDILIAAFAGLNFNSGRVNLGGTQVNASSLFGTPGDITIIAGAQNTTAITLASVGAFGAGTGNINIVTAQPISSDGNNIVFNANGQITSGNSLIAGPTITPGANIQINAGDVSAGDTVSITAGGSINQSAGSTILGDAVNIEANNNITNSPGATVVGASILSLTSLNGNIGTSTASRLNVEANQLVVSAANGSAFVNVDGQVEIQTSAAANTLDLQASGEVTSNGVVSANVVAIRSTGDEVNLTDNVNATNSATIQAFGDLSQTASINAPQVNLRSDAGDISALVDATNLTINALNGDAFVADPNSVNLGGGNSFVSGILGLSASDNLTTSSNLSGGELNLAAGNSLGIAGNITATSRVDLSSINSIQDANITGTIVSPSLCLSSSGGDIGTSAANPLDIDANNLSLEASGSVWVKDPNSVTLAELPYAINTFSVVAANNIVSNVPIEATDVILEATTGSLVLNGLVRGMNSITLESGNSITSASIAGGLDNGGGGAVNNLTLTSTNGNVGSAGGVVSINAGNVTANAAGNVYISNTSLSSSTIEGSSGLDFSYSAGDDILVNSSISAGRNVTLSAGNSLFLNAAISATGGNISLNALDYIFQNMAINASGNVSLVTVDNSIFQNAAIVAGGNVFMESGQLLTASLFANKSITATGNVTLRALGDTLFTFEPIQAINGDIIVLSAGSLFINESLTAGRDVIVSSSTGDDFLNDTVDAGRDVSINSNADISLAQQITAGNSITLSSLNSITDATLNNTPTILAAPQINLTSLGSIGTSGNALEIDAVNLTLNAFTDVYVVDPNSVNLGNGSSSADTVTGTFYVAASTDVTSSGSITSYAINISGPNSIAFGANVSGTVVSFGTLGTITNAPNTLVTATQLSFSGGNDYTVGSASSRFHVDAVEVNVHGTPSDLYLDDVNSIAVGLVDFSTDLLDLVATNNISITGSVQPVSLVLNAVNGTFQNNGSALTTNASITTGGSMVAANGIQNVFANNLSLTSTGGSIGSTGTPVQLSVNTNNLTANAPTGSVYLSSPLSISLPGASGALNDFSITAGGNVAVPGTISANNVSLTATAGGHVSAVGPITGVTSISITSDGSIASGDFASGSLVAPTINLTTTTGGIIAALNTTNVSFNSAGAALITNLGALNVISGSATGNIQVTAQGNLSSVGLITGTNVELRALAGGSLDLDGLVSGTASITLRSSLSILNSSIAGGLDNGAGGAVPILDLTSDNGNIGANGQPLLVNAVNLRANAPAGSVYISDSGDVVIDQASGSNGTFSVTAANNLSSTAAGTVTAPIVELTATGGALTLAGLVTGSTSVSLTSNNTINDASVAGGVTSPSINFNSTATNVNITSLDFTNVTAKAAGSVTLVDTTGSMNIGAGASTAGTSFSATAPVNITNDGTINAADVSLTATTGGFTFNNVVNGTASITLTSAVDILNGVGLGQLITTTLNATSTGGDIGQALDPLDINVTNVVLNAPTGSVFVHNSQSVSVSGASGAADSFVLEAAGSVSVNSTVSATDAVFRATGLGGIVDINNTVTGTASITVSSNDGIFNGDIPAANIVTPRLNLITTFGSIGISASPLNVNVATLTVQSQEDAFINAANSVDVASASAAGTLQIVAANNLTSSGTIQAVDVSLAATAGGLTLNGLTRGTNSISLTSANSILDANIVGGLDSGAGVPVNQLNLNVTGGNIGNNPANALNVDAVNLRANASGSVFIIDPNSLNLGGGASSSGVGQLFRVVATGALSSTSAVSGGTVDLTTGNAFDLDGLVTGSVGINLSSNASILDSNVSGGLTTPSLTLSVTVGDIGASADPLDIGVSDVRANASGSVYLTDPNSLQVNSNSAAGGTFSVTAGTILTLTNNGGPLAAPSVSLSGGTGVALNVGINASVSTLLSSGGTLTQTAGSLNTAALTLGFVTGPVTLTTSASTLLTTTGAGQTLTINEASGIHLLGQAVGTLNLNAVGNVTTGADFSVAVLNIVSNGNVTISNNLTATTSMSINTAGGSGFIQQTAGTLNTPSLTVAAAAGGIGGGGNGLEVGNGAAAMALNANATGGGDVVINYFGTGLLTLAASAGNDNFTLTTTGLGDISTGGNISGTGALNIVTDNLTNANVLSFNTIDISSPVGTGISVNGGAGGTFTTVNGLTITADDGDMNLSGVMTFNGTGNATLTLNDAENDFFIVNAGANVNGVNTVTVNACNLVFNGIITGNPLVIVCDDNGTIANSTGDVTLPSDLVFVGQNLAILAAGNITTTGSTLIDLSGPLGSGSLTLMAGYDFTPTTGGQVQSGQLFTITGVNPLGGSIQLANLDIVLNGGAGSGGNVLAVANVGTLNDGSITIGSIDSTGTNNGGSVNIIGPGGITIGDIDTQGGLAGGNVSMSVATPTIVGGPITVQNGVLVSGSFGVGVATAGDLLFNDINASTGDVTLRGALGAGEDINQLSGNLTANQLFITIGDGLATIANSSIDELNASGGGGVVSLLSESDAVSLNSITGANLGLSIVANGAISTGATAISIDNLSLETSTGDIVLGGNVNGATFVSLDSAGTITQTAGTIGGGNLTVNFVTGPVTLATSVASLQSDGGTALTVNEANDLILNGQLVDALTVNVTSGNVTTGSDFAVDDLTINVVNGTLAVSNIVAANNTATIFADDGVTSTGAGVIAGATVLLDTNADLGVDASNKLQINANTFQIDAQDAFVNNINTAAATLNASTATGTLDVSTAGDLVSGGNYSAQVVALATGGAFDLTSTITGTTSVSLTTDGDLTNITGTLTTPTLLLNSVNGNVGTDANNPFLVAANVTSIGGSAGDGFFVTSAATDGVSFVGISTVGDISLKANGGLNLTQNITSTAGAFAVQAANGILDVNDGISILAHDQIDIVNLGVEKKRDKIILGNGASIVTNAKTVGLGNVNILLGPAQSPGNKIPTPKKNVTIVETGGQALFGGKKAQAAGPGNVITAQGADVYISTFNPKSVVLEGNVIITADPPVAAGTQTVVRQFTAGSGSLIQPAQLAQSITISGDLGLSNVAPNNVMNLNSGLNTANLQMVSLNNATMSSLNNATLDNNSLKLMSATGTNNGNGFGTLATNEQTLQVGALQDDSFMTTSAPGGVVLNASLCSDMSFTGDAGMKNVETIAHSELVSLEKGSVLFAPTTDTTVVTPKGRVKVAANALAVVVVDDNHLSVYDVNDMHKNSVTIEAAGRTIPLSPGKHAVVTHAGVEQFAEINPVESMMHRGMSRHELGNGRRAFVSEFSVPSAIQTIKPLSAMVLSNHSQTKKVKDRVLKTSAIIMQLSPGTPYEFHAKPRTVALGN